MGEALKPWEPPTLSARDREALLDAYRQNPDIGHVTAFYKAGYELTRKQARLILATDERLREEIQYAKTGRIQKTMREIAEDPTHPQAVPAGKFLLQHQHPDYRDKLEAVVEHTGTVEVQVEHDYGRLLDKLEQIGVIRRAPADPDTEDPQPDRPALLPAPAD